ncbi:MAG: carotenoid oxygenase family protein [Pseudomonadota bacterium]|jgi:Lignostilbene-alpha,beta-dioxygenase and related enzymes|nr:MAG: dioxygenase [Pseudomonadota bacterium]
MVDLSPRTRSGFAAPQRFEADVFDCDVIGRIPADLEGMFVRVGGDPLYPPKYEHDSSASSDGYISAFWFHDGYVDYRGRYVKTERLLANKAARRQRFGVYRNPFTDEPGVESIDRTVANTAPYAHAGKLFALKEDSLPYEIDPVTLETIGRYDFNGQYKSLTFTAHPKTDPFSGEMVCYGYEATGLLSDDLFVYTIDRTGQITREWRLKVPYVSMMHDMALTQKHILFPVWGYVTSMERLKAGEVHWGWDDKVPMYMGVLPRDGDARDVRWIKGPPGRAIVHTVNAWSEGDKVYLEAPMFTGAPFPDFKPIDGSPWDPAKAKAYFTRFSFDLSSKDGSWSEERLFEIPVCDLARVDDRFKTVRQRYAFTHYHDPKLPSDIEFFQGKPRAMRNCYGRFDMTTGEIDSLFAGPTHGLQECQFVPRRPDAEEGDGYLIGVANNYKELRSELIIADAKHLKDGEIARVILPFRAGAQIHCTWLSAEDFPQLRTR